ncbi:MAG: OmpA family protein [Polyangiaceae bacterium]|jgi:peptidoglycan-associated lipoprotein
MRTTTRPRRFVGTVAFAALALLLGACASKQMHAAAPAAPPAQVVGQTNMQAGAQIPNTPTASNIAISEEVLRACNIADGNAYFRFDSSQLTTFDHAPLDAVAVCFTSGPMAGRKLDLVGHADPRGTQDYNMTLGQSRADAVGSYLAAHGLNRSQVTSTSRGAMDATGRDETGWAHDRRVDITLDR